MSYTWVVLDLLVVVWIRLCIFTADVWHLHRKTLQPAFTHKILNSFIGKFVEASELLCNQLEPHVGGPSFQIEYPISLSTFSSILGKIYIPFLHSGPFSVEKV